MPRSCKLALILLCTLALPCVAAESRPLALQDYYRLVTVQAPAMSPDGRWVAFVKTTIAEAENRRLSEVWLVASDGKSAARRVSDPALNATGPRWSPDSELLAFTARRRGANGARVDAGDSPALSTDLRSASRAGSPASTQAELAAAEASDEPGDAPWFVRVNQPSPAPFHIRGVSGAPVFSPDNKWIAFTRRAARPKKPQYADDAERLINERFKGHAYDWLGYRFDQRGYLPDPRDPDASPAEELFVVAREGGEPRQLTHLNVDVHGAAWRPDSSALAFSANTHQRDEYTYERSDLFVATLDGNDARLTRLTDDGYNNDSPAWSPDSRTLAFRRELGLSEVIAAKQDHGAPVQVFGIAATGGAPKLMTTEWDLLPGAPAWSADGRAVYFSAGVGGNQHLFRIATANNRVEQITRGQRQISGFSPSSVRTMAYVATDGPHPAELFVAALDGSGERRLTSFNDALLQEVATATPERIVYPSKDGTPIEGWVLKPRGYDPAKRWPLVVTIHGGPHGAFGNDFSFEHQLLAARGYMVLYTNPRGSTNYGEKFLWATWGGWGNLDADDVLAGVDYVAAHYSVDPKRLGVSGYSYGGFLTNWIIGHTQRFAAAVVGAGPSNWISDYGTADIPRTKESEFYGAPWDARAHALLLKQSPVEYAGNITTPTLFVHGESDMRVPIEQGEQMYTALKKRHVPARFVRYADSFHGGWSPWSTVHRYYEELKWWDRYLGGTNAASTAAE